MASGVSSGVGDISGSCGVTTKGLVFGLDLLETLLADDDDFADDATDADDEDGDKTGGAAAGGLRRAATNENTSLRI